MFVFALVCENPHSVGVPARAIISAVGNTFWRPIFLRCYITAVMSANGEPIPRITASSASRDNFVFEGEPIASIMAPLFGPKKETAVVQLWITRGTGGVTPAVTVGRPVVRESSRCLCVGDLFGHHWDALDSVFD